MPQSRRRRRYLIFRPVLERQRFNGLRVIALEMPRIISIAAHQPARSDDAMHWLTGGDANVIHTLRWQNGAPLNSSFWCSSLSSHAQAAPNFSVQAPQASIVYVVDVRCMENRL